MKRILVLLAVVLASSIPASTALAADPEDALPDLQAQGYYVEPGARSISLPGLEDVVAGTRNAGSRFMVAILDEEPPGGPTTFADAVLDGIGEGTIIVLTRGDQVGVASTEFDRGELDAALDQADARGGDDLTYVDTFAGSLASILSGSGVSPAPQPTTAPAEPAGEGGGGGGLLVLLLIVGGLILVVVFVVRRSNKRSEERAAADVASARAEIQKQLDAMANDILELSDTISVADNEQASELFQAATATYNTTTEEFEKAQTFNDLADLAGKLDLATWQLDAAAAIVSGEQPPPKPAPRETARCFFDPVHQGPFETAQITTAAGAKEVRVCRADADKLRRGQVPESRTIQVGRERVPVPTAPRSHGGGGFDWMDAFSILVGGMGAGLPVRWSDRGTRRAGRRAASRRSGGPLSVPLGRPSSSRGTRSWGRSGSRTSRSSGSSRTSRPTRGSTGRSRTGRRRRR